MELQLLAILIEMHKWSVPKEKVAPVYERELFIINEVPWCKITSKSGECVNRHCALSGPLSLTSQIQLWNHREGASQLAPCSTQPSFSTHLLTNISTELSPIKLTELQVNRWNQTDQQVHQNIITLRFRISRNNHKLFLLSLITPSTTTDVLGH